jgi:diguanylate cyclase (GGDEF)-like protein
MHSFRFKLGILLAIIAGAFIVSQVVYRNTITSMHDSVFSAVDTLEIVHRAEHFHSSIHMMLYLASLYSERKDEITYREYETRRISAGNMIDALIKSGGPVGDQHHVKEISGQPAGDLRSVFHAFAVETDAVFSGTNRKTSAHLEKARILFDDIFRNHLTVIHDYHEARLVSLRNGAHEMNKKANFLFYGQLIIIFLAAVVALAFSERVLLNLYTTTERHAFSDGLTGLRNRRYLDDVVVGEARDLIHKDAPFSILFADIDHFKSFNDAYGHQAGDKLLNEFADHLRQGIRRADTVVRYGGEEFLAILPGADKDAATTVAEKMRKQIESADVVLPSGEPGKKITASFGIASFPDDGIGKFTDLLNKADERLYLAKTSGRNRVIC